jgi:hypothetical protein
LSHLISSLKDSLAAFEITAKGTIFSHHLEDEQVKAGKCCEAPSKAATDLDDPRPKHAKKAGPERWKPSAGAPSYMLKRPPALPVRSML